MRPRFLAIIAIAFALPPLARAGDAEDLQSPDVATRGKAAKRLGKWQAKVDPVLTPILVDRLREDPDPGVRAAVAHALSNVQPPQKLALAALVEVIQDSDEVIGVRRTAISTLAKLGKGSKRVAEALASVAEDPDLTFNAVQALVATGAEEQAKTFLTHKNAKVRDAANNAYLGSGGTDVLAVSLGNSDPAVRRKAAAGIADRDYSRSPLKPSEVATLIKYTADADIEVRSDITLGLAKAKQTSQIIPTLVEGITSSHEKIRWTSAEGLGVAGPGVAEHIPAIIAVMEKTPPGRMKDSLIRSLGEGEKDAKPALPALFALLKDKNDGTRLAAVRALLKAAAADPPDVVKQVRPLLNVAHADTRDAANKVLTTWAKLDVADLTRMLRERDLDTAMKGVPLVQKLGPDAKSLIPELLALAARVPQSPPNFAGGDEIRRIALAVAAIGPAAVPALSDAMKSATARHREVAADAFVFLGLDAVDGVAAMSQGVLDANRGVRIECARALAALGYRARAAIPNLIQSLTKHTDSAGVVAEAICWIGASGDDAKKLIALAKEPTAAPVRVARILALGGAGKDALPVLEEIKKGLAPTDRLLGNIQDAEQFANRDHNLIVQLALLSTKGKSAPEAARNAIRYEMKPDQLKQYVEGLIALLDTGNASTQAEALRYLGWVGPDAAAAVPAIEKLMTSPDETVQKLAKQAIQRIRK